MKRGHTEYFPERRVKVEMCKVVLISPGCRLKPLRAEVRDVSAAPPSEPPTEIKSHFSDKIRE